MWPATSRGELAPRSSRPWRVAARVLAHTTLPTAASFTFSQSRALRLLLPPSARAAYTSWALPTSHPLSTQGKLLFPLYLYSFPFLCRRLLTARELNFGRHPKNERICLCEFLLEFSGTPSAFFLVSSQEAVSKGKHRRPGWARLRGR